MSDDGEPFVVDRETVLINGEWYEVENTTHFVADGQEYIFFDDKCYELNDFVVGNPVGSIVQHETIYFKGEKYDLETLRT